MTNRGRIVLIVAVLALAAIPITLRGRFAGHGSGEAGDEQTGCGGTDALANQQAVSRPAHVAQLTPTPVNAAAAPLKTTPAICLAPAGTSRQAQVCWRWHCDGDVDHAARWSGGDSAACTAGDLDADAADQALRRINAHRFIADVNPVTAVPTWAAAAQQCALIAHANAKLSHEPPTDWKCWSESGAKISGGSLVANRSVVPSIVAYFEDPGNDATMVHRRWLLDEKLGIVTFGSTDRYSCVVVDGAGTGRPTATTKGRGWAAWPPAGPVPIGVFQDEKLDTSGWTVQSTSEDLDAATVTVTVKSAGDILPVTLTHLTPLLGSRSAIRFLPNGWTTDPGKTYDVHIDAATPIDFTVEPTDC